MRYFIRGGLLLFTVLFFHDVPLEWQGCAGFIIGTIVSLTFVGSKK
ncbi:hypothetical protein [Clostridium sporogenes]|nr:hypothetical protein [Clostridium sporogenes]